MVEKVNGNAFSPIDDSSEKNKKIRVAVVDDFTTKSIFVDNDITPDIPHGRMVKRYIEEGLPDAQIDAYDTKVSEGDDLTKSINSQLDEVLKNMDEKGIKYDALNLSSSDSMNLFRLSELMGEEITPQNISAYKEEIRNLLENNQAESDPTQLKELLQKLDILSSKGVDIYVAAGNNGKYMFNTYTLAKNVKSIGATFGGKDFASFSADNSLITSGELGFYRVKKIDDEKQGKGFDFTGDGTIDVKAEETSCFIKKPNSETGRGTSFSCPRSLVKGLKEKSVLSGN